MQQYNDKNISVVLKCAEITSFAKVPIKETLLQANDQILFKDYKFTRIIIFGYKINV